MPRRSPAPRRRAPGRPPVGAPVLTVARITEAADQLMTRHGWSGLSMRGLATALGVDAMAVYRHVPSKAAVGALVIAQRLAQATSPRPRARRVQTRAAITARLVAAAQAYLRVVGDAPTLVAELLVDGPAAAPLAERWDALVAAAVDGWPMAPARRITLTHTLADYLHGHALAPAARDARAVARSVRLIADGALADARGRRRTAG